MAENYSTLPKITLFTAIDGMGMCCEKKTLIRWRNYGI